MKDDVNPIQNEPALERKGFDIIINGREHHVDSDQVSYDYVVDNAYPDGGRGELIIYTVLYYEGAGRPGEGGLDEDQAVKIKDGTIFNVTRTDRS